MAEIIWSPSALNDITAIAEYIANDSLQAAENMVELFFEKAKVLEKFPLIGKSVPEIKSPVLREILVSRYRIIYEIHAEDEINILTIHHQSRLLKNNKILKRKLK